MTYLDRSGEGTWTKVPAIGPKLTDAELGSIFYVLEDYYFKSEVKRLRSHIAALEAENKAMRKSIDLRTRLVRG